MERDIKKEVDELFGKIRADVNYKNNIEWIYTEGCRALNFQSEILSLSDLYAQEEKYRKVCENLNGVIYCLACKIETIAETTYEIGSEQYRKALEKASELCKNCRNDYLSERTLGFRKEMSQRMAKKAVETFSNVPKNASTLRVKNELGKNVNNSNNHINDTPQSLKKIVNSFSNHWILISWCTIMIATSIILFCVDFYNIMWEKWMAFFSTVAYLISRLLDYIHLRKPYKSHLRPTQGRSLSTTNGIGLRELLFHFDRDVDLDRNNLKGISVSYVFLCFFWMPIIPIGCYSMYASGPEQRIFKGTKHAIIYHGEDNMHFTEILQIYLTWYGIALFIVSLIAFFTNNY